MGIQINGNTNNINAGIGSLSIEDLNELDIVGVATAANFKTGVSNLHNVGLTLSGGQIDVGSNIKIGTAGVITATSFVGSGANLTGLPATTTINSNVNNYVVTATGTANTLQGESSLTYDGSKLTISGSQNSSLSTNILSFDRAGYSYIDQSNDSGNLVFRVTSSYINALRLDQSGQAHFGSSLYIPDSIHHVGDTDTKIRFPASNTISFETAGSERLRFDYQGSVIINGTTSFGGGNTKLQVRGASSQISDGAQIFDVASTAASNGGTRLSFGVYEDNYTWIRSYESAVGARDMVFAVSDEKLRIMTDGELRLLSQNGNNSDTPGIRFRGGSSTQKANFARIHSRMVSNWGGQLQFKVKNDNGSLSDAYQTAMIMNHNAHVTKPNQPSFHVGNPNLAGYSSGNVWRCHANAIYSNVGSHYNNSNGRFTAPVDGQYFFFHWGMSQSSGQTCDVYSRKNGSRDQIGTSYNQPSGAGHDQFGCSYVRTLSAGDYVDVYTSNGNVYNNTDGRHGGWGGWLIG